MKHNLFDLLVLSPEKELFSGKVESVAARALDGEIGIFARHAPLLSILRSGQIKIVPDIAPAVNIPISGGVLHVEKDLVQLFVTTT
ncbi:MAG: hypothetical protein WCV91_04025 [Candidatus Margulisiibacteriota bacterium]|jgi:F-type H+-transporting ATPase subunit epsilon